MEARPVNVEVWLKINANVEPGKPTNGVRISDITVRNVTGTATGKARNYYILCGEASCKNFNLNDISINGGNRGDSCNIQWSGNFKCGTSQVMTRVAVKRLNLFRKIASP
jgi:Glycosyl hydrolases family 28